jgi:hypothetical protein
LAEAADPATGADAAQAWLGMRGFAAGFQAGLSPFLDRHGAMLDGVTVVDRADLFIAHVAGSRPDYVLVAGPETGPHLLSDIAAAARGAALALASVGPLDGAAALPDTIMLDHLEEGQMPETVALRLRALIRRCRPQALTGRRSWGDLTLDEACMTFSVRGRPVSLRRELLCVLGAMMDDPARVWDRETLHRLVFGQGSGNDIRAIDTRISRARRHVSAALGCDPIRTVRGVGYALVPAP